ncbi:PH domain-containing protein [Aeromicrobium wangtongii]|uniref:PH domain-containing protein n=1 Tax=Aeromicrobium wangtongii TaxID=2969247 RepID=UPI0020175178|nr:PH domain-containing protein [Aeromicrobium wangtongii]MCL3819907.1 PH domain-containing protein [Aeromicrobium wangtongii]
MSLPRKLMIDGEQTVETTRTHVKKLFVPFLVLLAVCVAAGFLIASIGDKGDGKAGWVVVAIAAVLIVWGSVLPFVGWYLWTYTLTNKRLVEQKGILTRTGRVIPLSRINDVAFEKNLNDRLLGCGTLIIHDASEQAGLELDDIPRVEAFHRTVTNLVFEKHDQQRNDEPV